MARNPVVLVAALAAAILAAGLVMLTSRGPSQARPIAPSPDDALRNPAGERAPARADPKEVTGRLKGVALPPGDQVIADALERALASGEAPSYKASLDAPFGDNAAQAVRDELRDWISHKMASTGFAEAEGKPTLAWHVRLDALEGGRYAIKAALRAAGELRFEQSFELPAAYQRDRLDAVLGAAFAPATTRRSRRSH
jgi:hypothetical protein